MTFGWEYEIKHSNPTLDPILNIALDPVLDVALDKMYLEFKTWLIILYLVLIFEA